MTFFSSFSVSRSTLFQGFRCVIALYLLVLAAACSRPPEVSKVEANGRAVGQFKGYLAVNQQIRNRVFGGTGSFFFLGRYFGESYERVDGLGALLGVESGQGAENRFQNGEANSMSMLLWNIGMTGLVDDLAALCGTNLGAINDQAVSPVFLQKLQRVCRWPEDDARSEAALLALWIQVMGYDAPQSEFQQWFGYFSGSSPEWRELGSTATVRTLLKTILLNPYFILER